MSFTAPSLQECKRYSKTLCNVLEEALKLIKPDNVLRNKILTVVEEFLERVKTAVEALDIPADVELHGSFSRDTWLSWNKEADVFILLREEVSKDDLKRILDDIQKRLPWKGKEAYAEHPYLRFEIKNVQIDLVPGFKVGKILSAVDRTPLHSEYLKRHLKEELKDEVRLLKAFLKGTGCYGAEIKVEGFSGYAAELLIINYGSFIRVLEALALGRRIFIDFTGTWEPKKALRNFKTPIVLIDPVDPKRNVTSALSWQTFSRASLAAKIFLKKPNLLFFLPPGKKGVSDRLAELLEFPLIVLRLKAAKGVPPDIYWGRAKRIARRIITALQEARFNPLCFALTEHNGYLYIVIVLETRIRPSFEVREGPPIRAPTENVIDFIVKWHSRGGIGPIFNRKLRFLVRSEVLDASEVLENLSLNTKPSFTDYEVVDPNVLLNLSAEAKEELLLQLRPLVTWYSSDNLNPKQMTCKV